MLDLAKRFAKRLLEPTSLDYGLIAARICVGIVMVMAALLARNWGHLWLLTAGVPPGAAPQVRYVYFSFLGTAGIRDAGDMHIALEPGARLGLS
jgi:hypothetical protein